eukprot:TRINITY_DN21959_c0_g1_i2.p1 TRINITY_DN21959_c0_g1~~TRINITY_DN21959_c0_g1_i2.p1  ORF type:complete len:200 (-),score=33.11 TRINITY_DN21959_c0_g1_i2:6-605(-)
MVGVEGKKKPRPRGGRKNRARLEAERQERRRQAGAGQHTDHDDGTFHVPHVPLQAIEQLPLPHTLYDKVLVDAECTHDGSIKHIIKYQKWGWDTFQARFLNPNRLQALEQLQRGLLLNGFRLLKPGGTLVYATCSFCRSQNEDVVCWLLENHANAKLCAVAPEEQIGEASPGLVPHTLRYDPIRSQTSALFIAKITKLS